MYAHRYSVEQQHGFVIGPLGRCHATIRCHALHPVPTPLLQQAYFGDDEDNQYDFWLSYSYEFETEGKPDKGDVGRYKHPYDYSFDYSYDFSFYHSYDFGFEFGEGATPQEPHYVRTATSLDVGPCWEKGWIDMDAFVC